MSPLSDSAFAILQHAVCLARDESIRTLPALRSRLLALYPQEPETVQEALSFWAQWEAQKPRPG